MKLSINKTEIDGHNSLTVDGRELHAALEVGTHYVTWIKGRISKFGFVLGVDFLIFELFDADKGRLYPKRGKAAKSKSKVSPDFAKAFDARVHPMIVYRLTLDMAKVLSLIENTDAGRVVRKFLIESERRLAAAPKPQIQPEPNKLDQHQPWNQSGPGTVSNLGNQQTSEFTELARVHRIWCPLDVQERYSIDLQSAPGLAQGDATNDSNWQLQRQLQSLLVGFGESEAVDARSFGICFREQ